MAARLMSVPELAFAPEESAALSESTVAVMTEFEIVPPEVTGKAGAVIMLATTLLVIGAPRVVAVMDARRRSAPERVAPAVASRVMNGGMRADTPADAFVSDPANALHIGTG